MSRDAEEMRGLFAAAREAGVQVDDLLEYVRRRLIVVEGSGWDESAIETARRIRRLTALGVNLPGVEIILHMRQRLISLQLEIDRLQEEMRRVHDAHEREIARLLREMAREAGE